MIKSIANLGFLLNHITSPNNDKTRPMTHKEQLLVKELELRELRQRNAEIESQIGILESQANAYARMQRESERRESIVMDELERVRMEHRALERASIETRQNLEDALEAEQHRHMTNLNGALAHLRAMLAEPTEEERRHAKEYVDIASSRLLHIGRDKP